VHNARLHVRLGLKPTVFGLMLPPFQDSVHCPTDIAYDLHIGVSNMMCERGWNMRAAVDNLISTTRTMRYCNSHCIVVVEQHHVYTLGLFGSDFSNELL
jgi:hypothetical protein